MSKEITQTAPSFQQDQKTKLEEVTRTVNVFQIQHLMSYFY